MSFLRFRLEIVATAAGGFESRTTTPRGEGCAPLAFSSPPEEVAALAHSNPKLAGESLFSALFQGENLSLYERCLDALECDGQATLRFELIFDPYDPKLAALQALPWELLRRSEDVIALDCRTSLVRYFRVPFPVRAATQPNKLRVLVMAAEPRLLGAPPLDLEGELRNLKSAVSDSPEIEIIPLVGPQSLATLRSVLIENDCHILHFMGHGGRSAGSTEQVLFLEGDRRRADPVNGPDLAIKLKGIPSLRLVVLNACESGKAAEVAEDGTHKPLESIATALVLGRLPAVIAMQKPVSDKAAIAWSGTFYRRLAAGYTIDAAMTEGRQSMHSANRVSFEWATPILFARTATGELFPARDLPAERTLGKRRTRRALDRLTVLLLLASVLLWARSWYVERLVAKGTADFIGRKWQGARDLFGAAKRLSPDSAEVTANLAIAEEKLGNVRAAEDLYREAARLSPESADRRYDLGQFLNDREDPVEAYPTLLTAIKLDPQRAEAYAELARAAIGRRMFGRARILIAAALKLDPERALFHRRLGEIELAAGKPAAAVPALEAALERFPLGDAGAVETLALLAQAHDQTGNGPRACRYVADFRRFDAAGISPESPEVEAIAARWGCPADQGIQPATSSKPLNDMMTAVFTQITGPVEILGLGVRDLPLASPGQIAPNGAQVRVPAGSFAGVACSNRRFVRLEGPATWSVSKDSCEIGIPLTETQYSLIAPRAGRFQVVNGILVLERQLHGDPRGDARTPVIVGPRNSLLRMQHPVVSWIRVPTADRYLVEWWLKRADGGKGEYIDQFPTAGLCSTQPIGIELCRHQSVTNAPYLIPGQAYLVSVSARDRETEIWNAASTVEVTMSKAATSEKVQEDLLNLFSLEDLGVVDKSHLHTAQGGLLASRGFYADAVEIYLHEIEEASSPELRVTLADIFLTIELNDLAESLYREALASKSPAVRAAAAFGLGRVEYENKSYLKAADHFEKAQRGFVDLGLTEEAAAAEAAAQKLLHGNRPKMSRFFAEHVQMGRSQVAPFW